MDYIRTLSTASGNILKLRTASCVMNAKDSSGSVASVHFVGKETDKASND